MSYFQHASISNSDIRAFLIKMGLAREMPTNMQAIYDFGTLFHRIILEPHLVNKTVLSDDIILAQKMRNTFFKDELCRSFIMAPDFQREHEFYDTVEVGPYRYKARAKADGSRMQQRWLLELKGLNLTTEKAFNEALVELDYDRAIVHYMLASKTKLDLVVGISKKKPELLFKKIVKMNDEFYAWGEEKLIKSLKLLRDWSPEDVELIAA